VVHDPVDHGGDGVAAEGFTPSAEGQVAGRDEGGVFVSAGDELEEQVRCLGLEGEVPGVLKEVLDPRINLESNRLADFHECLARLQW